MMLNKSKKYSRAHKILRTVLRPNDNYDSSEKSCDETDHNPSVCPESPLPSGAEYVLEGISFLDEILKDSLDEDFHTDIGENETDGRVEQSNITRSITATPNTFICMTPMPSPLVSFSPPASLTEDNTSLPSPVANNSDIDNFVDSPRTFISVSEPAVYSSGDIFSPSTSNKKKKKFTKRRDLGRLRRCYKENWIDMTRKSLKNKGQEYCSRDGKVRAAKTLGPACKTSCKLKCSEKFIESVRHQIFSKFWDIGDHIKQWDILAKYVNKINKRRCVTDAVSRRSFTHIYFLPVLNNTSELTQNNYKLRVCRTMFLNTFSVSEKMVRTAIDKHSGELTSTDNRGRHQNHPKVVTDTMVQSVCDHVRSFAPIESHYCRKDSNRLYLDGSLTFRRMFTLYKEWFDADKYDTQCNNLRQYRDIVNKNINLSFHKPKKDLCDTCHIFKTSPETQETRDLYFNHIKNKKIARILKDEDKKISQNSDKVFCGCYDMQKILYCPHGDISLFYYKSKLKLYNFTIFDVGQLQGYCYLWTEQIGKKGPNEVSSFVYDLILKKVKEGYNDLRFWSDNCSGQNRNRIVFFMYLHASKTLGVDIKHTFLEKGHTQSEVDSVHATIEKSLKFKIIYTPAEWSALIRWCKQTSPPYNVIDITQDDILDFKKLQSSSGYNWTKNSNGDVLKWSKIKQVRVLRNQPGTLFYKYNLDDDSPEYSIKVITEPKVTRSRNRKQLQLDVVLQKCYSKELPIKESKKKDLVSLCDQKVIPLSYHNFFKNLISKSDCIEDSTSDEE